MMTNFEHSVKVPRHYKVASNILRKVSTEGGSVKTLLYDQKLKHYNTNVLYALISESIKHAAHIDSLFEDSQLLSNEPRLDQWLAKILTTELLFGKKTLPGESKPVQTILSYKDKFEKYVTEHQDELKTEAKRKPRYVRINTNLLTTSDAIRAFQDEGYNFVRCTSSGYDEYLKQIQELTEDDFTQDYHVKTVFVFATGTRWHEHPLYLENQIILQDKATALAVHLLAPPAGSTVLDMCAAPGNKTTQLSAYLRNQGKIYAVERNENRYKTLCEFVEKTGCKNVITLNKDSLEIKRGEYDDVEYILLDPSCSGSGMEISVHNYIDPTRLAKLTSLQEKFLKHAMNAFPKAKRIIYSTCSLYPEENERVVTNIVKASRAKWRVQDVKELLKGQWNNVGSNMYGSIGTRCLYAKPDSDLTTGFFLAVIDRDEKDLEKALAEKSEYGSKKKKEKAEDTNDSKEDVEIKKVNGAKKKKNRDNDSCSKEDLNEEGDQVNDNINNVKSIKKKFNDNNSYNNENKALIENNTEEPVSKKEKKKKSKKSDVCIEDDVIIENTDIQTNNDEDNTIEKKNKKKIKKEKQDHDYDVEINDSHDVDTTKKNKKRKLVNDETVENELPEKTGKKKKKHTSNKESDDCNAEDMNDSKTKKKNKKEKREKDVESSDINTLYGNEETVKKKKKRSKEKTNPQPA